MDHIRRRLRTRQTRTPSEHSRGISAVTGAEHADDHFFQALVEADVERVGQLVAEDFLIVDVMSGQVADRNALLDALGQGHLKFQSIYVRDRATRRYGDTAVIVGTTEMAGTFEGAGFSATSRYTHVLTWSRDGWRLVSAQGTKTADPSQESPGGA